MSTARYRSRESSTVAPSAPVISGELSRNVLAETEQACGEILSDAQSSLLAKTRTLCQKVEALRIQRIPMVSDLVTKVQTLQESNIQVQTADEEHDKERKDLQEDVSCVSKLRAGTAQEMDQRLGRTAKHLAKLQKTNVRQ